MKKRLLFLFTTLFFAGVVVAQQKPQYTQYVINNYIINPALTGIENYTDIKLAHRHQWVGLQEAPVTSYLTIHAPIGKRDYKTNVTTIFPIEGDNPRGKDYRQEYEASAPHHGIGLQIVNDKAGYFTNFSAMATYAYHIGLNNTTNLSAGIGIGLSKFSLNTDKLFFGDGVIDPAVYQSGVIGKTRLDINAGLWLYGANYFVGLSALQLMPQKIDFSEDGGATATQGKFVPHLFLTAGYRFFLSDDISLVPSVMVKNVSPVPVQVELNGKLLFQDLIWVGGSYRNKYGYAAMVGVKPSPNFMVAYAYDYSTTQIKTVSSGTHEIMIGFIFGNNYNSDTCPKNVW